MRRMHVLLAALVLCCCDQPPTREITAAGTQIEQARKAGAERYAPERWREAQAALKAAQRKVQEKDYRGALSSANEATEKARAAMTAAASARVLARGATDIAQAEIRAALEEVDAVRQEAAAAKIPDVAFQDLEPLVAEARDGLQGIAHTLDRGEVLEAQKAAGELKVKAAGLPTAFREARAKWEAEHPKARRKKR